MPPTTKNKRDDLERERDQRRREWVWAGVFPFVAGLATWVFIRTGASYLLGSLLLIALLLHFFVLPDISVALVAAWKKAPPSRRQLKSSAAIAVIRGPARTGGSNAPLAIFLRSGGFKKTAPEERQTRIALHDRAWRD